MCRGKQALLAGLLVLLVSAPAAHAACDWPVAKAHATHSVHGKPAPLAIGDSTMIFAVPYFARHGFDANARVCRSVTEGVGIMRRLKRAGRLPSLVVLALGANSPVRPIDVRRALRVMGPKRKLVLVTHRTWFGKAGSDTATIRRLARQHRKRVKLVDWVAYARPHPSWFVNDGLHTNELGSRKFAAFIAQSAKNFA
jgi:lysophospholipase L1-like esterase